MAPHSDTQESLIRMASLIRVQLRKLIRDMGDMDGETLLQFMSACKDAHSLAYNAAIFDKEVELQLARWTTNPDEEPR